MGQAYGLLVTQKTAFRLNDIVSHCTKVYLLTFDPVMIEYDVGNMAKTFLVCLLTSFAIVASHFAKVSINSIIHFTNWYIAMHQMTFDPILTLYDVC